MIALGNITGGQQEPFVDPTYVPSADTAPDTNGRQYAITSLGGTQVGVTTHSVSSPFTITFVRPKVFKTLGQVNPVTGSLPSVPKNQWKVIVRKGMIPLAGQSPSVGIAALSIDIPAGSDIADAANIKALISALSGALMQVSDELGKSIISGIL